MEIKWRKFRNTVVIILFGSGVLQAEGVQKRVYPLNEIWKLATENNQSIKITEAEVALAAQQAEVARLKQLPVINTSVDAFYLGDATILDRDFSNKVNVDMPHFGNSFTLQAQETIFKGKAIRNTIELTDLQHQLSGLKRLQATREIKLLVTANYLDLFKLYNQRSVYLKNIELAEGRLRNVKAMYRQELVTVDDVIRTQLMVTNLHLDLDQIENNISIINKQLTMATGLDESVSILPDSSILLQIPEIQDIDYYLGYAENNAHEILTAKQNVKIAEKSVNIAKSERSPALALFAANSLQRPITSTSPVVDKYSNGWEMGASLSFSISSIYTAPKNITLSRLQLAQSQEVLTLQEQNTNVAIHTAFIKHSEAIKQLKALDENKKLASENYRMIEKKYENQLSLLIDMLDASNSKLSAELQYTNAQINIIFTYYQLLNVTGSL